MKFKRRKDVVVHIKTHSTEHRYVCVLCWRTYETAESFRRHNYSNHKHLNNNRFNCRNKPSVRLHSKDKTHLCGECSFRTAYRTSMALHIKIHSDKKQHDHPLESGMADRDIETHSGFKLFKCGKCSYNTNSYSIYSKHISKHSELEPTLKILDKERAQKKERVGNNERNGADNLSRPLVQPPNADKPCRCAQCSYSATLSKRRGLVVSKHSGDLPFSCSRCNYRTANHTLFKRHLIIHPGNKSRKFHASDRNGIVKRSNKSKCLGKEFKSKLFKCTECSFASKRLDVLNIHKRRHSGERPFACPECNYQAVTKNKINMHIMIHSGDKPHKCPQCPYACNRTDNLKKHITWKHSGKEIVSKPIEHKSKDFGKTLLACPHCSYRTPKNGLLKRHIMIHTGEKPLKCSHCPYACNRIDHLKKHITWKHSGKEIVSKLYKNKVHSNSSSNSSLVKSDMNTNSDNKPLNASSHKMKHGKHVKWKHSGKKIVTKPIEHKSEDFGKTLLACPHCSYRTPENGLLKRHIMIHTGEKPIKCPHCFYSCIWKGNLSRHIKRNHSGKEIVTESLKYKEFSNSSHQPIVVLYDINSNSETKPLITSPHKMEHRKQIERKHLGKEIVSEQLNNTERANSSNQPVVVLGEINTNSEQKPLTTSPQKMEHQKKIERKHLGKGIVSEQLNDTERANINNQSSFQGHRTEHSRNNPYACPQCNYSSARKSHVKRHSMIHSGEKPHKCQQCPYASICNRNLNNHIRRRHSRKGKTLIVMRRADRSCGAIQSRLIKKNKIKHSGKTLRACPHCNFKVANKLLLTRHLIVHSEKTHYKCKQCSYTSFWKGDLIKHFKLKHSAKKIVSKLLKTTELSNDASKSSLLKSHTTKQAEKEALACPHCDYRTTDNSHLTRHVLTHNGAKSYERYKLTRHDKLIIQIRKILNTEKTLSADKCQSRNHKCHTSRESSGEQTFACPHCKYRTALRYRLTRHLIIHSGEKPYKCPQCPYASLLNRNLKEHIRCKHSGKETVSTPFKDTERSNSSSQSSLIKSHVTKLSGEKPFACPHCSYRAARKYGLTRHLLIHLVEKSREPSEKELFSCSYCNYRAPDNRLLKRHLTIHTGEQRLKCPQCRYESIWSRNLSKHIRCKHPDLKIIVTKPLKATDLESDTLYSSLLECNMNANSEKEPLTASSHKIEHRKQIIPKHLGNEIVSEQFKKTELPNSISQSSLEGHGAKRSRKNSHACPHCDYRFTSNHSLTHHLRIHSRENPYKCPRCPFTSKFKGSLSNHIRCEHIREKIVSDPFKKPKLSDSSGQSDFLKNYMNSTGQNPLKCPQCPYACFRHDNLSSHIQFKHLENKIVPKLLKTADETNNASQSSLVKSVMNTNSKKMHFACPHCSYQTSVNSFFNCHLTIHSRKKPYKCMRCSYAYFFKGDFINHLKWKHSGKEMLSKPLNSTIRSCDASQSSLPKSHNIQNSRKTYLACPHCSYRTLVQSFIQRHLMMHSRKNRLFWPQYPSASIWNGDLIKHMKFKHSGKDVVSERIHHSYAADLPNLQTKRVIKHSVKKSFACPHCNYRTSVQNFIYRHLRVHLREKSYRCSLESDFKKDLKLDDSRKEIVSRPFERSDHTYAASPPILSTGQTRKKRFACPHCNFQTSEQNCMYHHLMVHIREKSYRCSQEINFKKDLKSDDSRKEIVSRPLQRSDHAYAASPPILSTDHTIIYSGKRPFACPHCSYCSPTWSKLQSHLVIHIGEKSHKCPQCRFASFWKSSLKAHIKTQHSRKEIFSTPFKYAKLSNASSQSSLKTHLKSQHSRKKIVSSPFKSAELSNGSSQSSLVKGDMNACSEKAPLACHICNHVAKTKTQLTTHLNGHCKGKPHKCALCPLSYFWKLSLEKHVKLEHSGGERGSEALSNTEHL